MRLFPIMLLTAFVTCSSYADAADTWVKDPTTDCKFWAGDTGEDVSKDIVSWSGGCEGGYASGTGVHFLVHRGRPLWTLRRGHEEGKTGRSGCHVHQAGRGERIRPLPGGVCGRGNRRRAPRHLQGRQRRPLRGPNSKSKIHGYGIYITAQGARYDGEFKDGLPGGRRDLHRSEW